MMHSKTALIAGILLSQALVLGCAKEDSGKDGSPESDQYHRIEARSETEARSMAMNAKVYCASTNAADCSPSVGMLVATAAPSGVRQCSAFLISPRIVMTNSHCIPAQLKAAGSDCSNRMWLHFPELSGYRQERVGCSRVLEASTLGDKPRAIPDYAMLLLDEPVYRPALEISRAGFKDGAEYDLIKIDPQSKTSAVGAMIRVTCKAVHNSILVPNSNDDESSNMSLNDCEVIQGNSGAPIVDSSGKARGVIQLYFEQNSLGATLLQMTLPLLDPEFSRLNAGTNLACLDLPSEVDAPLKPGKCAATLNAQESKEARAKVLNGRVQSDLAQEMEKLSKSLPKVFDWNAVQYQDPSSTTSSYSQSIILVPSCIRDPKPLMDPYRGWFGRYDSKAETSLSLPTILIKGGINRYFVPEYRIQGLSGSVGVTLSYSPRDLAKNSKTQLTISQSGPFGANRTILSQPVGLCETK